MVFYYDGLHVLPVGISWLLDSQCLGIQKQKYGTIAWDGTKNAYEVWIVINTTTTNPNSGWFCFDCFFIENFSILSIM